MRIHLPRSRGGEPNHVIVTVNGLRYQIMRGVEVEVPETVAEILEQSGLARREAEAYQEAVSSR